MINGIVDAVKELAGWAKFKVAGNNMCELNHLDNSFFYQINRKIGNHEDLSTALSNII